jgi:hypothetical protein
MAEERLDEIADSLPLPAAADAGGDAVGIADTTAEAPEPSSESESNALDRLLSEYDDGVGNVTANGTDAAVDSMGDYTPHELARLLGEADQEAAARQQSELALADAQQRYANDSARSAMDIAQRDRQVAELQQTVGQLQDVLRAEQQRQHQARAFQDFKRLTADEQAKLDGLDVPENHVETFLLAEAARDPDLTRAFEGRYYSAPGPLQRAQLERAIMAHGENLAREALLIADPQQRRLAEQHIHAELRRLYLDTFPDPATYRANAARYLQRALDKMHKDARKPRLDPDRTADRFAVAQAVRGASSKADVREPAPAFGELSDSALNAFTKQFNFRAI